MRRATPRVVVAIDQGTTGSTVLVLDRRGRVVGRAYQEFTQHFPKPGWVEHDPEEIWRVTSGVLRAACRRARVRGREIAAIGITNQRETTVIWDRRTGRPVHNAIVWQDRRTAPRCDALRAAGAEKLVRRKAGLVLDPYFSGTKIALAAGTHAAGTGTRRARRAVLRHHRQLAGVEADGRGGARHRRHERVTHVAL